MSIAACLREIARGRDGARPLTREQACGLMTDLLHGRVTDLELGAFCVAMRVKGETPQELAGFLDAIHATMRRVPGGVTPTVVLPSYNGARRLPVLTPLLALMLAQRGCRVIVHGQTDDPAGRLTSHAVLHAIKERGVDVEFAATPEAVADRAGVVWLATWQLLPGLQRVLDARRVLGLRNTAHSLVKLMQPVEGALLVSSYTHPEYLHSTAAVLHMLGCWAMLLRGTEGEPVADPRRLPRIDAFEAGRHRLLCEAETGSLAQAPDLPDGRNLGATVDYTLRLLHGITPCPAPLRRQAEWIFELLARQPAPRNLSPVTQAHLNEELTP